MKRISPRPRKLLHLVVGLGAAMTGTAAIVDCGDDSSTCSPGTADCYAQIAYNADAYAQIAHDTGGDAYAHIAFNPDATVPEASSGDDASDASDAPSDATDSG